MLLLSLLHFRDRDPVCGRRIMSGAQIMWFAVAPCSAAGAERGTEDLLLES